MIRKGKMGKRVKIGEEVTRKKKSRFRAFATRAKNEDFFMQIHYLEEVGAKLNSLLGVPVPIKEADDEGCPRSNVAMSHGAPIRMVEVSV